MSYDYCVIYKNTYQTQGPSFMYQVWSYLETEPLGKA